MTQELYPHRQWCFHCIGYCAGSVPDITGTLAECYAQLEERDFCLLPEPFGLVGQELELTHIDNAGSHICRWFAEPARVKKQRKMYWFFNPQSEANFVGSLARCKTRLEKHDIVLSATESVASLETIKKMMPGDWGQFPLYRYYACADGKVMGEVMWCVRCVSAA